MWDLQKTVAGVDGCKGGWIACVLRPNEEPVAAIYVRFADLIDALPADAVIAVDMPIGFLDWNGPDGRGPEKIVRDLLRPFQNSVFPMPSRSAILHDPGPSRKQPDLIRAHAEACLKALDTSMPRRKFPYQAFCIANKIRELDDMLAASCELRQRVIESHPEVAFWRLNGESPVSEPKKHKHRLNLAGMEIRKSLLEAADIPRIFLDQRPPKGAKQDDLLDAAAMLVVARRRALGEAISYPTNRPIDRCGIEIAIWA